MHSAGQGFPPRVFADGVALRAVPEIRGIAGQDCPQGSHVLRPQSPARRLTDLVSPFLHPLRRYMQVGVDIAYSDMFPDHLDTAGLRNLPSQAVLSLLFELRIFYTRTIDTALRHHVLPGRAHTGK